MTQMLYMFPRRAVVESRGEDNDEWSQRYIVPLDFPEDIDKAEAKFSDLVRQMMQMRFVGELRIAIYPQDNQGYLMDTPHSVTRYVDMRHYSGRY